MVTKQAAGRPPSDNDLGLAQAALLDSADHLQPKLAAVASAGMAHLNTSGLHKCSLFEVSEISRQVQDNYPVVLWSIGSKYEAEGTSSLGNKSAHIDVGWDYLISSTCLKMAGLRFLDAQTAMKLVKIAQAIHRGLVALMRLQTKTGRLPIKEWEPARLPM